MEVEGFLRTVDEESSNRLKRRRTFKWLRGRIVRSSVDVLYLILTRPGFANPKEALEEYVKRHRFKDSMVRLATVVWVAGALAYLIFPDSVWAGEAALAAVNVLPVYVATMFVMEQLDEAREEVFGELAGLIGPDGQTVAMRSST
jgi:fatty acid desaturase